MLEGRKEEIIGRNWFDVFIPERMRDQVRSVFERLMKGEVEPVEYYENPVVTLKGRERMIAWHNTLIRDEQGRLTATLSSGQDITEARRAEKAIRESYETLVTVLDSLEADIYTADLKTHEILFANRHMKESFGRELVGQICHQVLRGEPAPCAICTNEHLLTDEGRPGGVVTWSGRNPLTGRWYMNYDQAIRWLDGRYVRLQVALDATEIKEAEQERQRLESLLRQAQKLEALGTLAGGIAHDFNNILGAITGYTELALYDLEEGESVEHHLRQILKASERARDLIMHILTFSRKTEQHFSPVAVKPILKESLKFLRSSLPADIKMHEDLETEDCLVLADPTQIHQVVINLCTNAAHAMRWRGGILTVALDQVPIGLEAESLGLKTGQHLRLTVSDTGHGMDQATLERIFEPYFTTKGPTEGTGLGLAVVHGIVKNWRGAVKVYSEKGKGTTFNVYLPLVGPAGEPELEMEAGPAPTGRENVLFVDDEKALADIGRTSLEHLGYHVTSVTSSLEALDLFHAGPDRYDLVITDQTMPELTGIELAEKMLEIRPDMPVILCTGFSQRITPAEARKIGVRRFLMKPMIFKELARVVREVLDERKPV
ncbi:MAG: ATP-binding protein [Thermodesulfobacteriota bacterium]